LVGFHVSPIKSPEAGVSELPCEDDDRSSATADGGKDKYKRTENERNSESVTVNERNS
jgi:hypothetical protein